MVASSNKLRLKNNLINGKYSYGRSPHIRPDSLASVQNDNAFKDLGGMPFYLNTAPLLAKLAVSTDKESAAHYAHELAAIQGLFVDNVKLLTQLLVWVRQ